MKNFIIVIILLVSTCLSIKAQDTIVLNNGQKILAKHIHIRSKLYYKHFEGYPNRKHDSINKSEVNYVIHQSGWKIPMIPPPWHNPITINPGIGLSAITYNFKNIITDAGANIISFSPVYSLNIEYAPSQKISFGIGVAWQTFKLNPFIAHTYTYYTTYSSGAYITGQSYYTQGSPITFNGGAPDYAIVETLTRLNVGGRVLYHIRNDAVKDFYLGVRVGLSFWTDQSNPPVISSEGNITKPSIQGIIGLRKDVTKYFGVQLEGALGSPYFADAGIYFKVNTKHKI